jgi:hypothetical protein
LGGRGRQISEFEASLVYKVSSKTARAMQRNTVSKNQKPKPKPKPKKKKKIRLVVWTNVLENPSGKDYVYWQILPPTFYLNKDLHYYCEGKQAR